MTDLEKSDASSSDSIVKNELIYFSIDPQNPKISYADLFEQHAAANDIEMLDEAPAPEAHSFPVMFRNMLARVENYGGNLGLFERKTAKPVKKFKKSSKKGSDSDTEEDPNANFYDLEDPFINDNELELGTEADHITALEEGYFVCNDEELRKRYNLNEVVEAPKKKKPGSPSKPIKTPKPFVKQFKNLTDFIAQDAEIKNKQEYNKIIRAIARQVCTSNQNANLQDLSATIGNITHEAPDAVLVNLERQISRITSERSKKAYQTAVKPIKNMVYEKKGDLTEEDIQNVIQAYKNDILPKLTTYAANSSEYQRKFRPKHQTTDFVKIQFDLLSEFVSVSNEKLIFESFEEGTALESLRQMKVTVSQQPDQSTQLAIDQIIKQSKSVEETVTPATIIPEIPPTATSCPVPVPAADVELVTLPAAAPVVASPKKAKASTTTAKPKKARAKSKTTAAASTPVKLPQPPFSPAKQTTAEFPTKGSEYETFDFNPHDFVLSQVPTSPSKTPVVIIDD